MRQNKRL